MIHVLSTKPRSEMDWNKKFTVSAQGYSMAIFMAVPRLAQNLGAAAQAECKRQCVRNMEEVLVYDVIPEMNCEDCITLLHMLCALFLYSEKTCYRAAVLSFTRAPAFGRYFA